MTEPESPASGFGAIPATARDAWLTLTELLDRVGPVPCCTGDAEAWWPARRPLTSAVLRALDACHRCPAQEPCLSYALAADERFGIWGGTLPDERRAMRWNEAARRSSG